jgi:hypothetical protein
MNPWFILILAPVLILLWILFFSHIFFHLTLNDKIKSASLSLLGCGMYLDWSSQKISFYLFNLKILSSSLRKKRMQVKKAGKTGKVNYIILWQKKDTIIKTLKIALRSFVDMLRKTKLKRLSLSLRVATPDPALTGVVYGGLSSISYPLRPLLPPESVHFYPDFEADSFKANLDLSLKTRFFHALWIGFKTFLLLPKISLVKTLRKLYAKGR